MINLLPPELKQSYHYAVRNVRLVRWAFMCGLSLVGLAVISTAGLIYVQQSTRSYDDQIATGQALLKEEKLSSTQTEIKDISSSLKLAVQVLSKEVLFSKLLTQLATITPSNSVLTSLNISQSQTSVDVTALSTDYNAAAQLQVNLADPANKLFSKADIVSVNCGSGGSSGSDSKYPCTATIRALFASNNPYLFINDGGTKP